jgi:hypothetical protein
MKGLVYFSIAFLISFSCRAQILGTEIVHWDFANGIPSGFQNTSASGLSQWEYRGPNTAPNNDVLSRGSCGAGSVPPASLTLSNGFVIFDSNYWDDPGTVCGGAIGSGADPGPQTASLITSSINLSAYAGAVLTFQQQYWHFQTTTTKVYISIDNGSTWTEIISNSVFQSPNVEWKGANISSIAGGQSNVRFKFEFSGFYYWWAIDDIVVYTPNNNDLAISNLHYTTNNPSGANPFLDLEYDQYPQPMIPGFRFSGDITNIGTFAQTNARMSTKVLNPSNSVIYTTQSTPSTISPGQTLSIIQSPNFTSPGNLGDYKIIFEATQSETDANLANNIDTLDYSITTYSYARDEGPMEDAFVPASTYQNSPLRIGNFYQARNSGLKCTSIACALAQGTTVGSIVKGYIVHPDLDSIIVETAPYTVNAWDINQVGQEKIITLQLDTPLQLFQDSLYLVMVGSLDGNAPLRVARSGIPPQETSLVNYPNEQMWFWLRRTPIVRMNIFQPSQSPGCTDTSAMNYVPGSTINDGSCRYPGCTNVLASNYDPTANYEDGSCAGVTAGCTDPAASNYNPNATTDDGSCLYPGCNDPTAVNYDPQANINDGSCTYNLAGCTNPVADNYNPQATEDDGSCIISGCTDPLADNYNPAANNNNGSCTYTIPGCTDPAASNYNPSATVNDGSCTYPIPGCTDTLANNYNSSATVDDGSCLYGPIPGCTDPMAYNYNPLANQDNGSCVYAGCTNPAAQNYNPIATVDDGTCQILGCTNSAAVNYNAQANVDDGSCIIQGCTDPLATNFTPGANQDNGSCIYSGCIDTTALNYNPLATVSDSLACVYLEANVVANLTSGCAPFTITLERLSAVLPQSICEYHLSNGFSMSNCDEFTAITVSQPGSYTIEYFHIFNGDTASVTIGPITVLETPAVPTISYDQGTGLITANTNESIIYWFLNGNGLVNSGNTLNTFNGNTYLNGNYHIAVQSANSCLAQSDTLSILRPYFSLDTNNLCAPTSIMLNNLTDWGPGTGCVINLPAGNQISIGPAEALEIPINSGGVYEISMTCNNQNSAGTIPVSITIYDPIQPVLVYPYGTTQDSVHCSNFENFAEFRWYVMGDYVPALDQQTTIPWTFFDIIDVRLMTVDIHGCAGSDTIYMTSVPNINTDAFAVYPNPASDQFFINGENHGQLVVTDQMGRIVLRKQVFGGLTRVDTEDLSSGVYQVSLILSNAVKSTKLIIEK